MVMRLRQAAIWIFSVLMVLGVLAPSMAWAVEMKAGVAKAVITPKKPLVITNGPLATHSIWNHPPLGPISLW